LHFSGTHHRILGVHASRSVPRRHLRAQHTAEISPSSKTATGHSIHSPIFFALTGLPLLQREMFFSRGWSWLTNHPARRRNREARGAMLAAKASACHGNHLQIGILSTPEAS